MRSGDKLRVAPGLPCVHCGLCLDSCPTYRVLGVEAESPRGRIHIMDAVNRGELDLDGEAVRHLDSCLGCLACETACPSGVSYGQRLEQFRPLLAQAPRQTKAKLRRLWSGRVAQSPGLLRTAVAVAHSLDNVGLSALRRRLPGLALLPANRSPRGSSYADTHRSRVPAPQRPRLRVALLRNCVANTLAPGIDEAAVDVLHYNNIEVAELGFQACCGALALHAGHDQEARALASKNSAAFTRSGLDAVVTTAAGCGAVLKDYGRLLDGSSAVAEAEQLASATRDICELLVAQEFRKPRVQPTHGAVAYHDACHLLHAQQLADEPRRVTAAATGHQPVDLGENSICCGSAGSYNLDQPSMGRTLGRRKASLLSRSGFSTVAVANLGCIMQIERALALAAIPAKVKHPIELLAEAYRRESLEANSRG